MEGRSMLRSLLVAALLLFCRVHARFAGPPVGDNFDLVCNQMMPSHGVAAQSGNGGYLIDTDLPLVSANDGYSYTAGQTYRVTLVGTENMFRGFLVIAHVPGQDQMLLGAFDVSQSGSTQQTLDCDSVGANNAAAVGHNPAQDFTSVDFMWQAPSDADGMVNFRYTAVQGFSTFYVRQNAAQNGPPPPPPTPATPTPPMRNPEDYQLTFRTPEGCSVSNCTIFVGIDVNEGSGGFLDIYMEGEAMGWVAVGFTEERNMFSADVVACNRVPANDTIEVLDTYNIAEPGRGNSLDPNQDVVVFNASFIDGRIICTVAKQIAPTDPAPQDFDLNSDLYVIWANRATEANRTEGGGVMTHSGIPGSVRASSPTPVNPVTGEVVTAPMRNPEDYQLTFRTPEGCNVSNCTSFVGIDVNEGNGGFLDIYMEGEAMGWVAVGFSETRNMFSADVVACTVDPGTNMVVALDTYNVAEPNDRNNLVDPIQNVALFNSSFDGSRIICTVAKQIAPRDPAPQDLDLNSLLYIMWGIRAGVRDNANSIQTHTPGAPAVSEGLFNPVTGATLPPLQAPVRDPLDYRLRIRDPAGCDPSSCNLYVGIDTNAGNNGFLDIYLEGNAAGWVAVGFSESRDMFAADVVGCNRDTATDMVMAVDTYNDPTARVNLLDGTQNVMQFGSTFTDGRISCTVSKQIAPSGDANEDLNLDNPNLYIMYGVGPNGAGAGALPTHITGAGNPTLSTGTFNPAVAEGEVSNTFPMRALLRAHGIIMLIAWPLLAVSGIFFAAWMRPALPNGEWFQIHRAFLLTSLFVGAIGFLLAFVAHAQNPTPGLINLGSDNSVGTAHYAIGIIVMFMHILNPLIAVCRCHPGEKYRWVFNLLHGTTIGLLAEILALTNIALGLVQFGPSSFFRDSNPFTIFWVYIAYLIFVLAVIGILFLIFTLLSLFTQDEDRGKTAPSLIKPLIGSSSGGSKSGPLGEGVELAVPGQKPAAPADAPEKPKVPSKDSPLRWGALAIFLAVNIVMMLVLIILIAIE